MKGRAVFRITLGLRLELLSLGGPQEGTRNSLIPGRLPPSGGHFSAKGEAPGSKRLGGGGAVAWEVDYNILAEQEGGRMGPASPPW